MAPRFTRAAWEPETLQSFERCAAPEPIPESEQEMTNAFRQAIALLRRSGVAIKAVDIADELKKLSDASDLEQAYEGARYHEQRLKEFGDRLDQPLADLIRDGL